MRSPGSERVSPNLPITCNMFSRPAIWMIGHRPSGETTHIDAAAARPPHFAASGNRHSVRVPRASTRNQVAHNRQYALPVTVVKSDGFEGVGRLEGLSVVLADRPRSSSLIPGSSFVVPSELRESAERLGFGWIVT